MTRTLPETVEMLNDDYSYLKSWGAVAEQYGVTKPVVYRMARKGYEPKDPSIRLRLGLSAAANVVVVYGEVPDGAQVLQAQRCACGQFFISNHPRRMKCFMCSPYRKRDKVVI